MSLSVASSTVGPGVSRWRRRTCRGCNIADLQPVLDLGSQHISGFLPWDAAQLPAVPLTLVACHSCGLVQLEFTTPPNLLYSHFFYRSSITQTMRDHLKGIVEEISGEACLVSDDEVLDIGANDGTLLGFYPSTVRRVAVEPAKNLREECLTKANTVITDLFPTRSLGHQRFQAITSVAMFYDVDDPLAFLIEITKHLRPTGVFVVQMNYLDRMVRDNAFDNIGHEHLTYYNMTSLAPLMHLAALTPYKAELNDLNGGSFRVFCSRADYEKKSNGSVEKLIAEEMRSHEGTVPGLQAMGERVHAIRTAVVRWVLENKNVWVCGASTRGNTLLQYFGLKYPFIRGAGERDERKYGLRTSGTNIPIHGEKEMRTNTRHLLALPWAFKREILERESQFLADGGEILFPLPHPVVVNRKGERPLIECVL